MTDNRPERSASSRPTAAEPFAAERSASPRPTAAALSALASRRSEPIPTEVTVP